VEDDAAAVVGGAEEESMEVHFRLWAFALKVRSIGLVLLGCRFLEPPVLSSSFALLREVS
jgi:hypothetical protein